MRPCYPRWLLVTQPPGHARLQRPQLDEARGGGLREQAAGLRERGEARVVDRVRRGARDDAGMALEEIQPHRPRDALVHPLHVGVEIAAKGLPPEPGVDEERPLAIELRLELVLVDRADEPLELLVRGQD